MENERLLLADLLARLPYGVKIRLGDYNYQVCGYNSEKEMPVKIWYYYDSNLTLKSYIDVYLEDYRPYLRTISSMTDEEMDRLFDILHIDKDGKDEDWIKINDVYGIKFFFPTGKWIEDVAKAYNYLYSIHIDFMGLISKGLAVKVNEKNNPYKD